MGVVEWYQRSGGRVATSDLTLCSKHSDGGREAKMQY
jgi:hypothetical protein